MLSGFTHRIEFNTWKCSPSMISTGAAICGEAKQ